MDWFISARSDAKKLAHGRRLKLPSRFVLTRGKELLSSIQRIPDRNQYVNAEVIITGDLEDLGHPCFAPRFLITAKRLEQLKEVSLVNSSWVRYGCSWEGTRSNCKSAYFFRYFSM